MPSSRSRDAVTVVVRISTSIVPSRNRSKRVVASEASTYSTFVASPRTAAAIALQNSMSKPTTLPLASW